MAKNKAKKNYVEDMDRDFNNAKFAHDLCVKQGRDTESLNEIVSQITLEAIGYVVEDLTGKLFQYVDDATYAQWAGSAYHRISEPWSSLVEPAYENNFKKTSKSAIALEALNRVSTFNDEELEDIEKFGKIDLMDLTINSFEPIREFYERRTI